MDKLIDIANEIYKTLGHGFSECIYHRAFEVCLREHGLAYQSECIIPIIFKNHTIGNIRADLIVADSIIVELKSVKNISKLNTRQLIQYIEHTKYNEGLVINFPLESNSKTVEVWKPGDEI